ncbi:MAG: hypothetical protein RIS94_2661 [Pseudomonadota bacterium]|jgi:hypothetical protein
MKLPNLHDLQHSAINALLPLETVAELIQSGAPLALAGTPAALSALPPGRWIGGTTAYFMTDEGGVVVGDDRVFVTDLSALGTVEVTSVAAGDLARISTDAPDHGFALTIIPAESECHSRFALEAPFFPDTFLKPTVGWIAGYDLAKGGPALVFDGREAKAHENRAVVAFVSFEGDALARPEIVNPFRAGNGAVLHFAEPGFLHRTCIVDGEVTDFAMYLRANGLDQGKLPLVGDHGGAPINVSVQRIDDEGMVHLYAPVFAGIDYRFAAPVDDYAAALTTGIDAQTTDGACWSCNCILNFMFGELEGKSIGGIAGPVTFGEIAYQLVNQTLVTLRRI